MNVLSGRLDTYSACQQYGISLRTFYRWLSDKDLLIELTGFNNFSPNDSPKGNASSSQKLASSQQDSNGHLSQLHEEQPSEYENLPVLSHFPFVGNPSKSNRSVLTSDQNLAIEQSAECSDLSTAKNMQSLDQCPAGVTDSAQTKGKRQNAVGVLQVLTAKSPSQLLKQNRKSSEVLNDENEAENRVVKAHDHETYIHPSANSKSNPASKPVNGREKAQLPTSSTEVEGFEVLEENTGVDSTVHNAGVRFSADKSIGLDHEKLHCQENSVRTCQQAVQRTDSDTQVPANTALRREIEKHRIEILWGPRKISLVWYTDATSEEIEAAICRRFRLEGKKWTLVDNVMDQVVISPWLRDGKYSLVVFA